VDSLHFDVSLFLRFKITFKKLPTSKVTKYFWMARGMIAKLWFTSDAAVWDSANRLDCTTSCQCQLQKAHQRLLPCNKTTFYKFAEVLPDREYPRKQGFP